MKEGSAWSRAKKEGSIRKGVGTIIGKKKKKHLLERG